MQGTDAARRAGDASGAAAYDDKARQAQSTADNWSDNGAYRQALHAGTQAAVGGAASGANAAAAAAGGTVGGHFGQQLGKGLGEQEADRRGLTGQERASFVNSYQQGMATVGGVIGGAAAGGGTPGAAVQGGGAAFAVDVFNRQLHPDERKWAKDNAPKYQQYMVSKTGEQVTTEEAYQRLLSAGYAIVDDAATKAGRSDETAKQYINGEAPKSLFAATAAERASPFLNGNADGSFSPEQQARFGTTEPGEQASTAVTKAIQYVGQPCTDCRNKAAAIDDAVVKLQEARVLYQDDPGSVKLIDQQIDQLTAGITREELVRGTAGVLSDQNKGIAALVLATPSRVVAGATTTEQLGRTGMAQAKKGAAVDIESGVRFGPANPGPLPDSVANTFRGGSYTQSTLSEPITLYRVSGGKAGELGQFWTTIRPTGPLQAQIDLALKPEWGNTATQITIINVPTGQTIYRGAAASQGGAQIGGGSQVFIPHVDPSWARR